jgi:CRP/FNR family transcriptional regulator, cyclic AMP receptor protein
MSKTTPALKKRFNAAEYLNSAGIRRKLATYCKDQIIFVQGDPSSSVLYLRSGLVKITVKSPCGKEAVIAILRPGDFFGEGSIAGQPLRVSSATTMRPVSLLEIEKREMLRVIHDEHEFSDRFLAHMLKRTVRMEADLVDQLFNSSEKRLARALLLIAKYGKKDAPEVPFPVSQGTLSEMIGTTRGRVNFFMIKFRKLGFISYNDGLQVHDSLLRVILDN